MGTEPSRSCASFKSSLSSAVSGATALPFGLGGAITTVRPSDVRMAGSRYQISVGKWLQIMHHLMVALGRILHTSRLFTTHEYAHVAGDPGLSPWTPRRPHRRSGIRAPRQTAAAYQCRLSTHPTGTAICGASSGLHSEPVNRQPGSVSKLGRGICRAYVVQTTG